MSLTTEEINQTIEKVQRQLNSFNNSLELICITHKTGGRKTACLSLRKGYSNDDISSSMNKLLMPWIKNESEDKQSLFLGTIETFKSKLVGLIKKNIYINVISLNTENYNNTKDLEIDLYRLSWNACNVIKNALNDEKVKRERILVPKPKGLRELGNNLQADIFASLMYSLLEKTDYVSELGKIRANSVISYNHVHKPENYPFIMALDQTRYIYKQLLNKRKLSANIVEQVWMASKVILQAMNQKKMETWQKFASYTQDMAWRGFQAPTILSIAIDRNDDIETKKLGVLVSTLSEIAPAGAEESIGYYNPFKSEAENAEMHAALIDETFENLLTRAIFENSSVPLIEKANEQNLRLQKGQFLGWCASALHDAAEVFEKTLKANQPPTQTTREIFKAALLKTQWKKLKILGSDILELRRKYDDLKMRDFINFLESTYENKAILESVLKSARFNKISKISEDTILLEDIDTFNTSEDDEIYGPRRQKKIEPAIITTH